MADFSAEVHTGPLFALAHATREAQSRVLSLSGTIYANALRTLTPPHGQGATLQSTKNKKSKGILALQARIAEDIQGGPQFSTVRAVRRADGSGWMAFDSRHQYTEGGGHFGMVVPKNETFTDRSGTVHKVPIDDPATIYNRFARWMKKNGRRRVWAPGLTGPIFVRAGKLRSFVAKKKKMAGFTISGWAHGARFFSTSATGKIDKGFFPALGGHGDAGRDDSTFGSSPFAESTLVESDPASGWLESHSWPAALKNQHIVTQTAVNSVAANALAKMERNILAWYKKKAKTILNS